MIYLTVINKRRKTMDYFQITNLIIILLYSLVTLFTVHFIVFTVVGLFCRKTFPMADEKLRYGVIIPARNEETVVGKLIESIRKCDYPQERLEIFVIAHNCSDNTASVARDAGATVYEYNNPEECTMGYAFRYLFGKIKEDYGIESFDGYFLFNADNILDKDYFTKMNDAFIACDRKSVITSFRGSKNFGSNVISAMYGLYFAQGCRLESRGRTALGCSTRVQGTGYLIRPDIVKDGWKYVTLTEDWEFTADQILEDTQIVFCDEAVFYDEQPTTLKIMWRQRLRWSKGHQLVSFTRLWDVVKGLLKPGKKGGCKHKFSVYDIGVNIYPILLTGVFTLLLQNVFLLLSPLFGISLAEAYMRVLPTWGISAALSYVFTALLTVLVYIVERKRIKGVSLPTKIASVMLMPFFLFVSVLSVVVALFTKNVGWKPIPHNDQTDFDKLNK